MKWFIDTHFLKQKVTLDMSTRILSYFCPGLPPTVPCLSGLNSLVLWFWLLFIWSLTSNTNGQAKELPTYKDNDFINDGQKICIDEENKKMFLEKLRKDVEVKSPPLPLCHPFLSLFIHVLFLWLQSTLPPPPFLLSSLNIHAPPIFHTHFCFFYCPTFFRRPQFLAQLKLMDYSLLVGIHDVERAEQEDVESEDNEAEEEGESDGGGIGTPPDSPSNTLDSTKPLSPGEFDPTIDVYAIKSNESE